MNVEGLPVELHFLAVHQRRFQNGFDLAVHPLVLFFYDATEVAELLHIFLHLLIPDSIYRKRDRCDRCFELMRHIIDEIILDLTQLFLSQHGSDSKIKSGDNDQREQNGRDDTRLQISEYNVLNIWYHNDDHLVGSKVLCSRSTL